MVARVCLVGDDQGQRRGPRRLVRVDVDPRPAPAVEPGVGPPRLPADEADAQPLARRQAECRRGPGTEAVDQPVDHRRQPIERDLEAPVPIGKPVAQRRVAGKERVDPRGRLLEHARRDARAGAWSKHRVTRSRYGSVVSGEDGRLCSERDELDVEPGAPGGIVDLGRQPVAERERIVAQSGRRAKLLEVDPGLEVGRPEVAVDEARDVLVEPQAEQDVVAGDRVRGRHRPRAADGRDAFGHRCILSGRGARRASWSRWASAWRRASARRSDSPGSGGSPARSGARSGGRADPESACARSRSRRWRRSRPARPRPTRRRTASPAARPRRGSSAGRPSSARRPRGRRPPPRPAVIGRPRTIALRLADHAARRGGSGPCSPTPWPAGRPIAGATSGARRATGSRASRSPSSISWRVPAMSSSRVMPVHPRPGSSPRDPLARAGSMARAGRRRSRGRRNA